ncbi:MAG: threonyl-tRNA synthetase editing domain-containing protein [Bacteroidales bacterium]
MKTLFLYCKEFGYTPTSKTLDFVPDAVEGKTFTDVQTIFIQIEKEDEENENPVFKKLVKQIKWIMKKNESRKLVLHSFAHLSDSKADPQFTMDFLNRLEEKMNNSGFETSQTPFGYFLDLKLDAPGFSLARVFKAF